MAWVPVNQTLILQPMGKVHGSLLRCDFTLLPWDCNQNGLRDQEQPDISKVASGVRSQLTWTGVLGI